MLYFRGSLNRLDLVRISFVGATFIYWNVKMKLSNFKRMLCLFQIKKQNKTKKKTLKTNVYKSKEYIQALFRHYPRHVSCQCVKVVTEVVILPEIIKHLKCKIKRNS